MFGRPLLPLLLLLPACATRHEALGNRALLAGDTALAADEYDRAMGDRPIMDFEYERIRKKRQRLMEGEWSPQVDALLATAPTTMNTRYVADLLALRQTARAAGIPAELADRIDVEVLRVATPEMLGVTTVDAVPTRLAELLALFDTALANGAPQHAVDAVLEAYQQTLAVGLPAPGPTAGLDRLTELLDLRVTLRQRRFPATIDAAIDAELARLAGVSFPPATDATALARFDATLALRTRARTLGAPAPAVALADAAHADAVAVVLALADAESAARRYAPLYDRLAPLAARVEPGHPLIARVTTVRTEGSAWHRAEAAALPAGYRRLLHEALAASLSGAAADSTAAVASRASLAPAFTTSLTLQPTLSVDPSCAEIAPSVSGALARGARAIPVAVTLSACAGTSADSLSSREQVYTAEEIYYVQEQVQVGVRIEQVQVGSHQEQCSQASSLEGYSWVGLCDVPDYESRQVPVFELQNVEKRRDVERTHTYTVTTRRVLVAASGVATLTWEDGTTLTSTSAQQRTESSEAWDYVVPGRTEQDAGRRYTQGLSSYVALGPVRGTVGSAAGQELSTDLLAQVRAHRANLARGEAARALGEGDAAAAGEAFVRSVLHDGEAEGDAAAWLSTTFGLAPTAAEALLTTAIPARPDLVGTPLPGAVAYAPEAIAVTGAALRADLVVKGVTTETLQSDIRPPNEFVNVHWGLVPTEIQTGASVLSRAAPAVGFDFYYNPLEMLVKLRYGLVLHDQLGLRFTLGMTYVPKEEYTNGEDEGPIALTVDPSYSLFAGLRLPYFGVFAGGTAGYLHAASGDTVAFGYHVEPAARLTLRLFGTHNLLVEGSGFLFTVPGVARKDRLMVSFPILGRKGIDLKLSVERTVLPARHLAADGESRESLGDLPVNMAGVQVGARF